jgi:hypothetical protein
MRCVSLPENAWAQIVLSSQNLCNASMHRVSSLQLELEGKGDKESPSLFVHFVRATSMQ